MKHLHLTHIILALIIATGIVVTAAAEDNPEEILKSASAATETSMKQVSLEQRWQAFLDAKDWGEGVHEGGIITFPNRDLLVSSASEFTKVSIGQPGWIESRIVAFERAELEAKTKIIRFLAETTETERSIKLLENAGWSDGSIEEAKQLGQVEKTLSRLAKKSVALSEALLDSELKKLDPDYDPEKYKNKTPEELRTIVEDQFKRRVKIMALKTLIGATTFYSTEGKAGGEYQVLVGVIWSPKLNRLALSLMNDEYNIPPVKPGKKLEQQLPKENRMLLGTLGTRIVIDEKGHYTVLAYAQAQPRRSSPIRVQSALQTAKQVAANRARAMIVNYIKEGLTLRNEEKSQELSREFSDMTVGTETLRKYKHSIVSRKVKVQLRGLRILQEWSMPHPETGQTVAGAVVAWSPSSATLSTKIDSVMKSRPKASRTKHPEAQAADSSDAALESMDVDTSAY